MNNGKFCFFGTLINSLFGIVISATACNTTTMEENCSYYHNGTFKSRSKETGRTNIIFRSGNIQREWIEGTNDTLYASIKWIGPCEYQLYALPGSQNYAEEFVAYAMEHVITVNIIEANKNYYIFSAKIAGVDSTLTDTIKLVQ